MTVYVLPAPKQEVTDKALQSWGKFHSFSIFYDVTIEDSFVVEADNWRKWINKHFTKGTVPILLVATGVRKKKESARVVPKEKGMEYASIHGLAYHNNKFISNPFSLSSSLSCSFVFLFYNYKIHRSG